MGDVAVIAVNPSNSMNSFDGELSFRFMKILEATVPSLDPYWRETVLEALLKELQVFNLQQRTSKSSPKFELGPPELPCADGLERLDQISISGNVSCVKDADVQVDLANLGPLPNRNKNLEEDVSKDLIMKLKNGTTNESLAKMSDREIFELMKLGRVKPRDLEKKLDGDFIRAVSLRRMNLSEYVNESLNGIPFEHYDYTLVSGACCENVVGYVPVPTGIAGPLVLNKRKIYVPLSTTEGALVASTNRGCRALLEAGGATARVYKDAMTRAPVLQFDNAMKAIEIKEWLDDAQTFAEIKKVFDSTSRFAKLRRYDVDLDGRLMFIRFEATTGDAMGMNMISKAVNAVMAWLLNLIPNVEVLALSGNYCVDKKASMINWIKGRGKSVVAEAVIPETVVKSVLRTTVKSLCRLSRSKLLIGSSMAGTVGGWNAHAANIVAALFLATGQDIAQIVSSSMCMTTMEETAAGDLYVTCNMRCLEVGTIGGGTILRPQQACLQMLGCAGAHSSNPGDNAKRFAEVICATVMAGELSLMAALCTDDLVRSHLKLNRSKVNLCENNSSSTLSRRGEIPVGNAKLRLPNSSSHFAISLRSRATPPQNSPTIEFSCSNIL
ncbi:hypothetical protein AB6A40_002624 [Gnathostoma spinigerum]|uniref:3-hydroxy-3-methylglutaryl coenzyme A reductase n=1 Tax=Gnathostoma spinigerum TaxID=75299 RepID=A0ABD6EHX2_9BILA